MKLLEFGKQSELGTKGNFRNRLKLSKLGKKRFKIKRKFSNWEQTLKKET